MLPTIKRYPRRDMAIMLLIAKGEGKFLRSKHSVHRKLDRYEQKGFVNRVGDVYQFTVPGHMRFAKSLLEKSPRVR